jgi:hypothetical protein
MSVLRASQGARLSVSNFASCALPRAFRRISAVPSFLSSNGSHEEKSFDELVPLVQETRSNEDQKNIPSLCSRA